ncbi:class I SAM-dependent methyltransferase [Echinicola sp. 20G]|uniref:class I SAM-dependent methyltransferase n=1 Tax=Echinicola sp. 20G TaxID=2781961 RepID=UPI0019111D6A|nr:class I SAM-dependent methyltransferase [Echinicola sp. 20G]
MIKKFIKRNLKYLLSKSPYFLQKAKNLIHEIEPNKNIFLDYPVSLNQRYSLCNPHLHISSFLKKNNYVYKSNLEYFLQFKDNYLEIPVSELEKHEINDPTWINGFIPGLDLISLYGFLVKYKPNIYIEVGSGNSTKIAKRAIEDYQLQTTIFSIDPSPRNEINEICDHIIRKPLEEVDLNVFNKLEKGDFLFIDNSHRVLMNSDAIAVFLDIIPNLKSGVIIQIHDVFLPYDYPQNWSDRFYSEQYMLANILIYGSDKFDVILPNFYISKLSELAQILNPIWDINILSGVERHGASFWFMKK